jgi:hypothetical protein
MATIGPVSTSTRAGLSLTSSAAKSVEVPRIRAEVPSCPFHRSDQIGLFRMFVCGECIPLGGELTLYRGANQVGLKRSAAAGGGLKPPAQFSGEPHGNTIVFHLPV